MSTKQVLVDVIKPRFNVIPESGQNRAALAFLQMFCGIASRAAAEVLDSCEGVRGLANVITADVALITSS